MHDYEFQFWLEQYKSLREEIGQRQARAAKIMYSALFGIPSIVAIGKLLEDQFGVGESLFLMAPAVTLVSCFVFVSEYTGMMRAGVYIRNSIEPRFLAKGEGWESWLFENENIKTRRVDNFTILSFFVVALLYFLGSLMAFKEFANPLFGYNQLNIFFLLFYLVLGALVFPFTVYEVRFGHRGWLEKNEGARADG